MSSRKNFLTNPSNVPSFDKLAVWPFVLLAIVFLPTNVWAQEAAETAITLGNIVCNVRNSLPAFAPLISVFAYTVAAFAAVKGVLLYKKHTENPNDNQFVKATAHVLVAGLLAAMPATVGMLQQTLHVGAGAGGSLACGEIAAPALATGGLDTIIQNFVNNIKNPMMALVSTLSVVMGLYLIFRGLLKGTKVGSDPRAGATHAIMANLLVGAVLVSLGTILSTMLQTVFGDSSISSFSGINWTNVTAENANTEAIDDTVTAVLTFVQVIGAIAFLRGWLMIKNAVEGTAQVTVPQGLTHVIGGTMAINIGAMLTVFDRTFGTCLVIGNC